MGAYGRTDLTEILLGSTVKRVVQGARCPVLTLHPAPSRPHALSTVGHILVPVDFSLCSVDALDYAASLATQFGALLTVFHVMEPWLPGREGDVGAPALGRHRQDQATLPLAEICIELRH